MDNILLITVIVGSLISLALLSRIFQEEKGDFFLGLVVFQLVFELLFSWTDYSGYLHEEGAIPFRDLINYLIIPPSLWLFIKYKTDQNFRLVRWHYYLFLPALLLYIVRVIAGGFDIILTDYPVYYLFTDYIPLIGSIYAIGVFWLSHLKLNHFFGAKIAFKALSSQLKLLLIMCCFTVLCTLWLSYYFIGWDNFYISEFILVIFLFGFTFLQLIDSDPIPLVSIEEKIDQFPNYLDTENLSKLDQFIATEQPYLIPNFTLKNLSSQLNLPVRYVSFLINHYHKKNYKEFMNDFRIETFLQKVELGEINTKTVLALALESGFNSKSSFNFIFKKHIGKTPSDYITQVN